MMTTATGELEKEFRIIDESLNLHISRLGETGTASKFQNRVAIFGIPVIELS